MLCYKNHKKQEYYLTIKDKTEKPQYYFTQKIDDNMLEKIPEGYEVYEKHTGQPFLRKIKDRIISDDEIEKIRDYVSRIAKTKQIFIEINKSDITICDGDADPFARVELLNLMMPLLNGKIDDSDIRINYQPALKFEVLKTRQGRKYFAWRYCFRDDRDWIELDESFNLDELTEKYCPYIGTEEIFELGYKITPRYGAPVSIKSTNKTQR